LRAGREKALAKRCGGGKAGGGGGGLFLKAHARIDPAQAPILLAD